MKSSFIAILLSSLLASSVAHAEEPRRVLSARQATSGTDQSEEYQKLAQEKRKQSIEFLKGLLSKGGVEGDQKAEMMLRLADLYFEEGRYLYLGEMEAYDLEYTKCFNTEGCVLDSVKANNTVSHEWQDKAIKLYQAILKAYPRYARADEAVYYQAAALNDMGRKDEAWEQFTNVVRQYPDSQWVPDSYVQIGEYHFAKNDAYKALLAYKKATAYPDTDMYGFATYKLGWCYYNVGEYDNAIATMQTVVKLGMASQDKSKIQLQDEALNDLVRFFADADKLDDAETYFQSLGKPDLYLKALKRIGATFFEQGKWEQCVAVYRKLIAENPNGPEAPNYQVEIIKAEKKMGKKEEILSEVSTMLKTYGKSSAWAKANAANPEALKTAGDAVELQVRQAAVEYHEYARKLKTGDEAKAYYALAYKSYKMYLEEFPSNSHAYEMHYAFGELLYKVKRYDEAFVEYMAVVKLDPKGDKSKFCAESAIFAADEMIKKEQVTNPTPTTPSKEAIPLTEWEQKLIDACAQYASLYPGNDAKNIAIIYKSAYLLYNKAHYPEAAALFNGVIAMDPKSTQAMDASHLMLDQFKIQENWDELKKNAKFYYEQPGLGNETFKKEVYDIYERASFKVIEVNLAKNNDKSAAADAFIAFYGEFPASPVAGQALNNATVYYRETSRTADEIKTRHILVDDPKFGTKTKYYYDQIGALGFNYETIADFGKAAEYYEKLFALYQKRPVGEQTGDVQKQAGDALYSAAVFRRASGGWEKSIEDYTKFTVTFAADPRVTDVKFTIAKIYEDNSRFADAATKYSDFYKTAGKDVAPDYTYFARIRYGKMLEAQGQKAKAIVVYTETVDLYDKAVKAGLQPGAYTEFVAEMMFILAEPEFDKYMALKIAGSGGTSSRKAEDKAIETSLKAKAGALMKIEARYGAIIQTGAGHWGLASLVKLGQIYENMGETLKTSSVPYYLDADQREMYKMAIEDKVYPQTQKAIAAYSAALGKAYELTLYDEDTALATRRLGVLAPDDYPGLFEKVQEPHYTSTGSHHYDFEKEL